MIYRKMQWIYTASIGFIFSKLTRESGFCQATPAFPRWKRVLQGASACALFGVPMVGCSKLPPKDKSNLYNQERVEQLSQSLREKQKEIESLKQKNVILRRKALTSSTEEELVSEGKARTQSSRLQVSVDPSFKDLIRKIKSEPELYAQIITLYRRGESVKLNYAVEEFERRYPLSIHSDNALYLRGSLHLQQGQYSRAIRAFDQVIASYPQGDKRVSALFAKAVAYRKLNLLGQARGVLGQLQKDYPGSREFYKAQLEIRSIDSMMESKKKAM
jgi:TolA-binding protein